MGEGSPHLYCNSKGEGSQRISTATTLGRGLHIPTSTAWEVDLSISTAAAVGRGLSIYTATAVGGVSASILQQRWEGSQHLYCYSTGEGSKHLLRNSREEGSQHLLCNNMVEWTGLHIPTATAWERDFSIYIATI
jgi:hypothetical protein